MAKVLMRLHIWEGSHKPWLLTYTSSTHVTHHGSFVFPLFPGYAEMVAQHTLKKFMMLVYFLDKAKTGRLIEHNPCLFCKDSEFKVRKKIGIVYLRHVQSDQAGEKMVCLLPLQQISISLIQDLHFIMSLQKIWRGKFCYWYGSTGMTLLSARYCIS